MALIIRDIDELLTLEGVAHKDGRHIKDTDLTPIKKAAMIIDQGKIQWVGENKKLPKTKAIKEISLKGYTVLPGFIECHTHLVYAGTRAHEFELRQQGISYQQISAQGGGILSTVKAVRSTSKQQLIKLAQQRADEFLRQGVTTLEIKSGYGLRDQDEFKMLQVANALKGPQIITTFLGPHSTSPDHQNLEQYLNHIIDHTLPKLKKNKLSSRVDIFIEKGFFTTDQARRYFEAAHALGFQITAHVEQLSRQGGIELACEFNALSVDHGVHMNDADIEQLAQSKTTAVLLPAADFYMKIPYPPARKLIDAGAKVALATDFNPGTSPTQDLSFIGMLARLEMKMSLAEVIAAYTFNAASALGLSLCKGALLRNYDADFIAVEGGRDALFYEIGRNSIKKVFKLGKKAFST